MRTNIMNMLILLNILTYAIGVVSWIYLYKQHSFLRRLVYGLCSHLIVAVIVSFTTNHIFSTYISTHFVILVTLLIGVALDIVVTLHKAQRILARGPVLSDTIVASVILILVVSFVTNVAMSSKSFFYIPTVGNNDDTATHLGMAVMTIKQNSLLFNNDTLESLISAGIDYQNARYYPPSVYTYLTHLYELLRPFDIKFLDLSLLMNIYGVFTFVIYLVFIFSIFELAWGTIRSMSMWVFTPLVVFGLFFVAGEYFIMLYRMSYLTQLLGNAFVLMFFRKLIDSYATIDQKGSVSLLDQVQLGILIVGVGLTYYLFLPIVLVGLVYAIWQREVWGHAASRKLLAQVFIQNVVVLSSSIISTAPLILYVSSYSLVEQITIPGINLITLASLIQFCLMVLVFVVLRRYFDILKYRIVLAGFLTSLVLAVLTLNPSSLKSGELPYYFFKSFFTSASFAVSFGIASTSVFVSHTSRYMHRHKPSVGFITLTFLWVIVPFSFVFYLYSYDTLVPGYKSITHIARASLNYYQPSVVKKLYALYERYHDRKIAVYNPGYWGENILLFALFENIPSVHVEGTKKKIFYFSSNPEFYMRDMVRESKKGRELYVFDGHGSFKPKVYGRLGK